MTRTIRVLLEKRAKHDVIKYSVIVTICDTLRHFVTKRKLMTNNYSLYIKAYGHNESCVLIPQVIANVIKKMLQANVGFLSKV